MPDIGIDLGTTTTLFAHVVDTTQSEIIQTAIMLFPFSDISTPVLPSEAYVAEDGHVSVGYDAKNDVKKSNNYNRYIRAVKRHMGRPSLVLPHVNKTPSEISSAYLQYVIDYAVKNLGFTTTNQLTITVPASFTAEQRSDTLGALKDACVDRKYLITPERLRNVLISEPIAALLQIINDSLNKAPEKRQINIDTSPQILVYDMGGGTLDITLVRVGWRANSARQHIGDVHFDIIEITRYNQFGGEDFDIAVAKQIATKLTETYPQLHDKELLDSELSGYRVRLLEDAEKIKKTLIEDMDWNDNEASFNYSSEPIIISKNEYRILNWHIRLADYLTWVNEYLMYRPHLKNALYPIEVLLQRTNRSKRDIDYCVVVGGMTRFTPLITTLTTYWGSNTKIITSQNPDQAVALGAAVYSALKQKNPGFTIPEPVADVYYVKIANGFDVLYNSRTAKQSVYHAQTTHESQTLELHIFTGDPALDEHNLASIYPTLMPKGDLIIDMQYARPIGTKVFIELYFRDADSTKEPYIRVAIDQPDAFISDKKLVLAQE
jgi:molecular chaperone DnaK (HSP70)